MSRSAHPRAASIDTAPDIATARHTDYVAFLHRVPFVLDAVRLGYLTGVREDYSSREDQYLDLDVPVGMLDNDFRNPDLERYVERFRKAEPRVGVIGDAYTAGEAREHVEAARELQASYPDAEIVIAPKCREAIDAIPPISSLATHAARRICSPTSLPIQPTGAGGVSISSVGVHPSNLRRSSSSPVRR